MLFDVTQRLKAALTHQHQRLAYPKAISSPHERRTGCLVRRGLVDGLECLGGGFHRGCLDGSGVEAGAGGDAADI